MYHNCPWISIHLTTLTTVKFSFHLSFFMRFCKVTIYKLCAINFFFNFFFFLSLWKKAHKMTAQVQTHSLSCLAPVVSILNRLPTTFSSKDVFGAVLNFSLHIVGELENLLCNATPNSWWRWNLCSDATHPIPLRSPKSSTRYWAFRVNFSFSLILNVLLISLFQETRAVSFPPCVYIFVWNLLNNFKRKQWREAKHNMVLILWW